MKLRDLVEELQRHDPDLDVRLEIVCKAWSEDPDPTLGTGAITVQTSFVGPAWRKTLFLRDVTGRIK